MSLLKLLLHYNIEFEDLELDQWKQFLKHTNFFVLSCDQLITHGGTVLSRTFRGRGG